ncbi:8031_t:CDS:2, partial [Gigaspora margarita]
EFFADKSKEPTLNDSILVEDNNSDEEIEEQENLARKCKINRNYKASKKAKKLILILQSTTMKHGGEVMPDLSKITFENSQANNSIDE